MYCYVYCSAVLFLISSAAEVNSLTASIRSKRFFHDFGVRPPGPESQFSNSLRHQSPESLESASAPLTSSMPKPIQ